MLAAYNQHARLAQWRSKPCALLVAVAVAAASALFVSVAADVMINDRLFRNLPAIDVLFLLKRLFGLYPFRVLPPIPREVAILFFAGGIFRGLMCLSIAN